MQADFANCKWIQNLFITKLANEQLKARARTLIYGNAEFKCEDLTIVSGIHKQI